MLGDLCPPKPLDHISKKKIQKSILHTFQNIAHLLEHNLFLAISVFFVSFLSILSTKSIISQAKSKGKLSPRSHPIQCERKSKYSFLSVQYRTGNFSNNQAPNRPIGWRLLASRWPY